MDFMVRIGGKNLDLRFFLGAVVLILVWFGFLFEYLQTMFTTPDSRFLVFNVGITLIVSFVVRSYVGKRDGLTQFLTIFLASFLVIGAIDILLPGYHVTREGVCEVGEWLGDSTTDYFVCTHLRDDLGLKGSNLFYGSYLSSVLFAAGAILLGAKINDLSPV